MKVLPTQNVDTAAPRTDLSAEKADKHAFKAALASAAAPGTDVPAGIKLRKGEEVEQVEGHAYVEVTSGAREGMYINTSGNVRNGEAFVLVRKNGKEYHIYGTGKDRLVVGFHMPSSKPEGTAGTGSTGGATPDASDLKLRTGEKIEPVPGHAYAEIVSGPRSGMYINTSGNARHGEAFVLVEKADVDYHIYGSGDDRLVIRAAKRDDDDK
jgi:hypothetical protein